MLVFLKRYVAKLLTADLGNPVTIAKILGVEAALIKYVDGSLFEIPERTLVLYNEIFDEDLGDFLYSDNIESLFDELLSDGVLVFFIALKHVLSRLEDGTKLIRLILEVFRRIGRFTLLMNGVNPDEDPMESNNRSVLFYQTFMLNQVTYFSGDS